MNLKELFISLLPERDWMNDDLPVDRRGGRYLPLPTHEVTAGGADRQEGVITHVMSDSRGLFSEQLIKHRLDAIFAEGFCARPYHTCFSSDVFFGWGSENDYQALVVCRTSHRASREYGNPPENNYLGGWVEPAFALPIKEAEELTPRGLTYWRDRSKVDRNRLEAAGIISVVPSEHILGAAIFVSPDIYRDWCKSTRETLEEFNEGKIAADSCVGKIADALSGSVSVMAGPSFHQPEELPGLVAATFPRRQIIRAAAKVIDGEIHKEDGVGIINRMRPTSTDDQELREKILSCISASALA